MARRAYLIVMRRSADLVWAALLAAVLVIPAPLVAQIAAGTAGGGLAGAGSPLLSVGELQGHVGYLASDALAGRRAGTPGAERALPELDSYLYSNAPCSKRDPNYRLLR